MPLPKKLYIVQKYVYATSLIDAIKKEKDTKPDDVYLDNNFREAPEIKVGFKK